MQMNKKNKIVEIAGELMSKKGYKDTTLEEIAGFVNLDKSTLFHYFKGKEEILESVVGSSLDEANDRLEIIRDDSSMKADEKLKLAIRVHIASLVKSFDGIKVFFDEFRSFSRKKRVVFSNERKLYARLFEEIVKEVQNEGFFKGLDSKIVAFGILGMCNWLLFWYKEDKTLLSTEEIAETFSKSLLFN